MFMIEPTGIIVTVQDVEMTLIDNFKPDIDILCYKNCEEKVNPSRRFVQAAACTNCWNPKMRKRIRYKWEVVCM